MYRNGVDLEGQKTNYAQPFIMISGNDTYEQIYEQFWSLKEMGIYSAVLQYTGAKELPSEKNEITSRVRVFPFNDTYFATLKRMSAACRELGMTFWVQDAAPFPTGSADGWYCLPEHYHKSKVYLEERHTNIRGPVKDAALLIDNFNGLPRGNIDEIMIELGSRRSDTLPPACLICALAMKQWTTPEHAVQYDYQSAIDLTDRICQEEGVIRFDLPEGEWRLFFIYETRRGGRPYFMNMLDADSVRVQIDAVLERHYKMLKDELGVTWEGFFYDESEIGNTAHYDFNCLPGYRPGKTPVTLPWSPQLPELLEKRLGKSFRLLIPALWYDCGEISRVVRYHFMDIVTALVSKNYNGQILPWCRERGIRYIGHVLEDENSHARLGCGAGHFFRVEKHQDMAGIDLIGGQLMPGMDMAGTGWYASTDGDGDFYHYGIAKLASSEGHINPGKNGKSFCEINAVYGDISNAKFYKYLIDHLLVNGINHLIPVITDSLRPEEGRLLFDYVNRSCTIMDGGRHIAPVAVLYHAESEWAGDVQFFQYPAKELARRQIDYDVIPCDALTEAEYYQTRICQKALEINDKTYRALIVPACRYIRKDALQVILKLLRQDIPVYFVDGLPSGYCEELGDINWQGCEPQVVMLDELAAELDRKGIRDIYCSSYQPYLRYLHLHKEDKDYYMFFNAGTGQKIQTEVILPFHKNVHEYDAMCNQKRLVWYETDGSSMTVSLDLGQYESRLLVFSADSGDEDKACRSLSQDGWQPAACNHWEVTINGESDDRQSFRLDELSDISLKPGMARYTGMIRYRTTLQIGPVLPDYLDLGDVGDSARVVLNGQLVGHRIAAPYLFEITEAVQSGANKLEIEILPNPARRRTADGDIDPGRLLSAVTYAVLPATGLMGPVRLNSSLVH